MNILRLFFISCCLLFTTNVRSQTVDLATETGLMSKNLSNKIEADGSPYIQESFERATVSGFPNQAYRGRYNAYTGEMEIELSKDEIIALDVKGGYEVTFVQSNTIYKGYSYENSRGQSRNRYLVVLQKTEEYALLKDEIIKYYDLVKATSSYQNDKPPKFKREEDQYYLDVKGKLWPISNNKKELQKTFPSIDKKLKTFIKDEKISLKNEGDLKKLSAFLASQFK